MKATGIVRRIDDLGRVVIPKEIGKTLRIREGTYSAQVISPIVMQGDPIGAVALVSKEPNIKRGELEVKLVETAAGFLSKQMEN